MTYPTFINIAYWVLLALIVLGAWIVAGLGFSLLWLRARRRADRRRTRDLRRLMIESARQSRALEDTCWFLLRGRDARIAETIADTKAVVRVLADVRQSKMEAV